MVEVSEGATYRLEMGGEQLPFAPGLEQPGRWSLQLPEVAEGTQARVLGPAEERSEAFTLPTGRERILLGALPDGSLRVFEHQADFAIAASSRLHTMLHLMDAPGKVLADLPNEAERNRLLDEVLRRTEFVLREYRAYLFQVGLFSGNSSYNWYWRREAEAIDFAEKPSLLVLKEDFLSDVQPEHLGEAQQAALADARRRLEIWRALIATRKLEDAEVRHTFANRCKELGGELWQRGDEAAACELFLDALALELERDYSFDFRPTLLAHLSRVFGHTFPEGFPQGLEQSIADVLPRFQAHAHYHRNRKSAEGLERMLTYLEIMGEAGGDAGHYNAFDVELALRYFYHRNFGLPGLPRKFDPEGAPLRLGAALAPMSRSTAREVASRLTELYPDPDLELDSLSHGRRSREALDLVAILLALLPEGHPLAIELDAWLAQEDSAPRRACGVQAERLRQRWQPANEPSR